MVKPRPLRPRIPLLHLHLAPIWRGPEWRRADLRALVGQAVPEHKPRPRR